MSERLKEHDWKSCVPHKGTMGSNPILCATKRKERFFQTVPFFLFRDILLLFCGAESYMRGAKIFRTVQKIRCSGPRLIMLSSIRTLSARTFSWSSSSCFRHSQRYSHTPFSK